MIAVQDIVDACLFELQAEDSDRYTFDQDFLPAINLTQKWLVSLYSKLLGDTKVSEESLRDLHKLRVFQVSDKSRVGVDNLNDDLWTITGVYPKVTLSVPITATVTSPVGQSLPRPDASVVDILKAAKRLPIEEWAEKSNNPLIPGYPHTNEEIIEYAYLNLIDVASEYPSAGAEITIAPDVSGEFIGISYLMVPDEIDEIEDDLQFPVVLLDLVINKVLHYIAVKEDDSLPLLTVTQTELNNAIALLS